LNVRIPIVTFLQGPSIAQFTLQLLDQLAESLPSSLSEPKASPARGVDGLSTKIAPTIGASLVSPEELIARQQDVDLITMISQENAQHLLAQLDQLSDSEVDALLNQIVQVSRFDQEEELH
jgi:hypothetical protein